MNASRLEQAAIEQTDRQGRGPNHSSDSLLRLA